MVVKKLNQIESAQNIFMQVGVDVKCMHTNFSGHGLSSFGNCGQKIFNFNLLLLLLFLFIQMYYFIVRLSSASDHKRAVRPRERQKPSSSHLQLLSKRSDISSDMDTPTSGATPKADPNAYSTYMGQWYMYTSGCGFKLITVCGQWLMVVFGFCQYF